MPDAEVLTLSAPWFFLKMDISAPWRLYLKVTVIGTGYVGLVTASCLSEMGNDVWCVDIDKNKIDNLNHGIIPIFEPGLEDMVKRNHAEGRLRFSTDITDGLDDSLFAIIAVGTPSDEDGSADL
jgi:UDPglucose 6-dehydrogenase